MKIFFCAYLREKWIALRQVKKKILDPSSDTFLHQKCVIFALFVGLSVCLSVCHILHTPFVYSKLECAMKVYNFGEVTPVNGCVSIHVRSMSLEKM